MRELKSTLGSDWLKRRVFRILPENNIIESQSNVDVTGMVAGEFFVVDGSSTEVRIFTDFLQKKGMIFSAMQVPRKDMDGSTARRKGPIFKNLPCRTLRGKHIIYPAHNKPLLTSLRRLSDDLRTARKVDAVADISPKNRRRSLMNACILEETGLPFSGNAQGSGFRTWSVKRDTVKKAFLNPSQNCKQG